MRERSYLSSTRTLFDKIHSHHIIIIIIIIIGRPTNIMSFNNHNGNYVEREKESKKKLKIENMKVFLLPKFPGCC